MHIKKFESFNSNPNKLYYYSCDECNEIWESNSSCDKCKSCESDEVEEINTDEYNELKKNR